jgi:hypothetical protein
MHHPTRNQHGSVSTSEYPSLSQCLNRTTAAWLTNVSWGGAD